MPCRTYVRELPIVDINHNLWLWHSSQMTTVHSQQYSTATTVTSASATYIKKPLEGRTHCLTFLQ